MKQQSMENTISIADTFWGEKRRLIREKVLPYQWRALNDRIPEAEPSYCIRNFREAAKVTAARNRGEKIPVQSVREFISLPEGNALLPGAEECREKDGETGNLHHFYGFVFQDSDLYKWIEAASYILKTDPDPVLEQTVDQMVELLEQVITPEGYLDTFYIIKDYDSRFTNLRDHHELYCFGHLAEAAVAYYEATGKGALLKLAMRFADYLCGYFGVEEGKCHGYPGHELAEMALMRLYHCTGDSRYMELSRYFVTQRGKVPKYFNREHKEPEDNNLDYCQADRPVLEQTEAVGHAVRAMYLYSGMTDLANESEDRKMGQIVQRLWEDVTGRKMYITGAVGGTHIGEAFSYAYDLPLDSAYAETCAAIGLVFWARRMLRMKPDRKYADVMERALYNGVLSGISLDGTEFFYVNPLAVNPEACRKDKRLEHVKSRRSKWFGCACCPPNLARLLGSLPDYSYHVQEDTLWLDLYMSSEIQIRLGENPVSVKVDSHLPWDSDVQVEITGEQEMYGTIALRIPGWSDSFDGEIRCEGSCETRVQDGYWYVKLKGQRKVHLNPGFSFRPKFFRGDSRVVECFGQMALVCGPLVYCLEEADNGKLLHTLGTVPEAVHQAQKISLPFIGKEAVGYRIPGWRRDGEGQDTLYMEAEAEETWSPQMLTFIPYYAWANREEGEMRVWLWRK